jgi:hypothetical protein
MSAHIPQANPSGLTLYASGFCDIVTVCRHVVQFVKEITDGGDCIWIEIIHVCWINRYTDSSCTERQLSHRIEKGH